MATKFITSGTLPSNTSGADLTAGIVGTDGVKRYYAVNRFAATGSAFLADNTSGWTGISGLTVTGNVINITAAVVMNRVGTPFIAVNKTVNISGSGLLAINGNANNHVYFINCTFNITATKTSSTNCTLAYVAAAGDATGRARNMNISAGEAATATLNLYGCVVYVASTSQNFNTYIGATDQIATDYDDTDNFSDTFGPIFGNGSRWIDVDILLSANKSTSSANFYGAPAVFSGVQLYNQGLGVGNSGVTAAALALTPLFTLPTQPQFMFLNANDTVGTTATTDIIVQTVDAPGMGATAQGSAGTVFGTLTGADGFVGWGGGNAQWSRAQHGFAQYRSVGYGFYSDAAQTTGVRNVRIRTGCNITSAFAQARWINKFPNTAPSATIYMQDLLTGTNGLPASEKYSLDGGTTFVSPGLINWGNGTTSAPAIGTTTLFTNPNGLTAPPNTYALPIQLGRATSTTTTFLSNPTITWSARSFTHNVFDSGTFAGTSNVARTTYGPVGNRQTVAQNANVKSAAITAMLATNNGNIDSYFLGRFTTLPNADLNDAHDAARYEFFNYALPSAPVVDSSGSVNVGSANFTLNANATGGTIATKGYSYDGVSNWTIRSPYFLSNTANTVNGSLISTGTITLVSQATQSGAYTPFVGGNIVLGNPGSPGTAAIGNYSTTSYVTQGGGFACSATFVLPNAAGTGTISTTVTTANAATWGSATAAYNAVVTAVNGNATITGAGWTASNVSNTLRLTRGTVGALATTTFTVTGDGNWNFVFAGTRTATITNGTNAIPATAGTTLYQSVAATTAITGLHDGADVTAQGVSVNFGTGSPLTLTTAQAGGLVNCQVQGVLNLTGTIANQTYPLVGGGLSGNLTINGTGTAIQIATQGFALNGFTLSVTGTAVQVNSLVVNIDATSRGGRVMLLTSGGTIVANQVIPSTGNSFTVVYPTSPAVDRAIIGNANDTNAYVPRVFSSAQVATGTIDATGLQATQASPAAQDATSFSTSFSGGITQFAVPVSQTGSTAGVNTAARVVRRFGDQALLQGINAAITGGFTLTQFINNTLSDTVALSTNLIQFISSDATQQRTIGGVTFTGDWYVQGATGNKTLGVTGALGVPQVAVPLNNQSASIGDVYTAEAQVVNALIPPMLTKLDGGIKDASLLIPYAGSVFP